MDVLSQDRIFHQRCADLFSIIVALDHLETAYIRGICGGSSYSDSCRTLIGQFKTLCDAAGRGDDRLAYLEAFVKENNLSSCGAAVSRLKMGIPARVGKSQEEEGGRAGEEAERQRERAFCVQATELFITVMN